MKKSSCIFLEHSLHYTIRLESFKEKLKFDAVLLLFLKAYNV